MEREVGGGIGMGKTCKLKAVSFQCMTKFTTNKNKNKTVKKKKKKRRTLISTQEWKIVQCTPNQIEMKPMSPALAL